MGILDNNTGSQNTGEGEGNVPVDYTAAPSYLVGADAHNYGNSNFAITDPSTWGEAPADITKFVVGSVASGATSLYNSGVTVTNWLGGNATEAKTEDVLGGIDDDLAQYYSAHKQGEDLLGFLATSIVPGTAGIKVLNAGQKMLGAVEGAGMGANLARATGLLPDAAAKFAQASASEIASSGAQISLLNQNTLKALAAGVGQNFLEGAAFTTAVQATMFRSPILQDQDGLDIAKNILTGGLVQGAIGGAFSAAKLLGVVKRGITGADEVLQPSTYINEPPSTATASDRIVSRLDDLANLPNFKDVDEFNTYANTVPGANGLDTQALFNRFQQNVANKTVRLQNLIQTDLREVAGGDNDLATQMFHTLTAGDPVAAQGAMDQMLDSAQMTAPLKTEAQILARAAGKGVLEDIEGPLAAGNKEVQYVKLFGDDEGSQFAARPSPEAQSLADRIGSGSVPARVASYGFGLAEDFGKTATNDIDRAEARYIWAKGIKVADGSAVAADDIPVLEQAYLQKVGVKLTGPGYQGQVLNTPADILAHLKQAKMDMASRLLGEGKNTDYIAKVTNVARDSLEHTQSADPLDDLFARQTVAQKYTKSLIDRGLWSQNKGVYDLDTKPSWAKVGYSTKAYKDANGNVVNGMGRITAMQKVAQQTYDNVFAKQVSDTSLANRFISIPKSILLKANRLSSGPGFFRFANGAYGSLASLTETIGKATSDLQRFLKSASGDMLDGPLYQLGSKPQAAIEFSSISNEIAATTEKYVLDPQSRTLIARSWKRYQDDIAAGKSPEAPQLQEGARVQIPITNTETYDAIDAHIKRNGERLSNMKEIRAAQGLEDSKDASTFYPVKPDPKQYPHFAFVVDPTISGAGHIKMIHATNAGDLDALVQKVPSPYRVITKAQSEEFHKTIDDYQWDRTLHENYIDSEIQSKGINSQFFPQTDPAKIVGDLKNFHLRMDDVHARELVNMKYQNEFAELRRLSEQWNITNTSRYGKANVALEDQPKNPYTGYVKTALNISRVSENPLWQGLNDKLDKGVSVAYNTLASIFQAAKTPEDLDNVNASLQSYGLKHAYQDAATMLLANKGPAGGVLRNFIGRANGILGNMVIGLDPLASLSNAIGHQVLDGSEFTSVVRAIKNGRADMAGRLAELKDVQLPGVQDAISSPSKMMAAAIKDFITERAGPAGSRTNLDYFKANGWIKGHTEQFRSILDDLTIDGTENQVKLNSLLRGAMDKAKALSELGRTASGSNLSEEFQGYVAAHVMKQLTDLAQSAGVLSPGESTAYINTFVNRVRGNFTASQRPTMFQGPIGQAIGLFQSYQYNMMQQMLRYAAEGSTKDVAMLLGLQGTIYGMQSLPAFNFINQHIVGTASGNPMHRDLYDATYGILGKTAGDFLMYGLPSNLLRTSFYTRGHLNPRNMTVVPTSLADVPIVNSYGAFFSNLKDTAGKIANGADLWPTMLSGLEHNAISRPLAGLAQVLRATGPGGQPYSTSSSGNILGSNDLLSIATLARLSGGKPLDESLINDRMHTISAYQAADMANISKLGEAVKDSTRGNTLPDPDSLHKFMGEYAAAGGNQKNFSKWMMKQMVSANTPQANRLAQNLNSPYSQHIQSVMGGGYGLSGGRVDPLTGMSYANPLDTGE